MKEKIEVKSLKMLVLPSLERISYDLERLPLELRDLVYRQKAHRTIKTMQNVLKELQCSTYFLKSFFDKRPVIAYHRFITEHKLQYYSCVPSPKSHLKICMRTYNQHVNHVDWYVLRRTKASSLKKTENGEKVWITP